MPSEPDGRASRTDGLIDAIVELATAVRMGDGIDPDLLATVRRELGIASARWRRTGAVDRETVVVLVEMYPALLGTTGLYAPAQAQAIEHLGVTLLDEILAELSQE
ncbi:hypothetical protein [Pimelobacter simplex]|uniref:hypothetical protein n=1 Tax=Nocardioides simplex TaxID=2045 RepID=UPI003AAB4796